MSWGNIAVGVRIGSTPEGAFFKSWTGMVHKGLERKDIILEPAIGMPHHYAAEEVAKQFLATKAQSLLFVDDDMVFDVEALNRLRHDRDGWKYDVLQAHYLKRVAPHHPLIIKKVGEGKFKCEIETPKDTIIEVGAVGLGFTLIHRRVFERILKVKREGCMIFAWGPRTESEDFMFSRQAEDSGSRLGVTTKVSVGHCIKQVLYYDG